MPVFGIDRAEYEGRVARVRERLVIKQLDGILISDPANMYYLTGYNAWSFYTPQALYVGIGGELVLMMREMDALGAHRTAMIGVEDVMAYPETLVHNPDAHPFKWCADQLRALGHITPDVKRIAYEGDAHFFSPRSFHAFTHAFPNVEFVDGLGLVNWLRLVKSDIEIDFMRLAGRVASESMRVGIAAVREGAEEAELAAVVMAQQAWGAEDVIGDYPAIVPMFPIGAGADTPHLTWTQGELVSGEPISIELAGVHRRYHAPLARTILLGEPSSELDFVAKVTVEGLHAALEALRPGNTPDQAVAKWDEVLKRNGLEKRSRLGYSIGVGYPPDWGERTVSLRAGDHTELQENMTFHVFAGMWMTGYGFSLSESVRITSGWPEVLTEAPRELIIKPV